MTPLQPLRRRILYVILPHRMGLLIVAGAVLGFAALMTAARGLDGTQTLASGLVAAVIAVSILLGAGVVSNEMSSGVMQIWLQRPVDPTRHYLGRLAETTLACCLLLTLLILASRLMAGFVGWPEPDRLLGVLPRLLLEATVLCCVGFAASAWMQRGAAILVIFTVLGGLIGENSLAIRGDLLGPMWTPIVRGLLHPDTAFREVSAFGLGTGDDILWSVARILAYATAWVIIGLVGARRAVTNGGVARAQAE